MGQVVQCTSCRHDRLGRSEKRSSFDAKGFSAAFRQHAWERCGQDICTWGFLIYQWGTPYLDCSRALRLDVMGHDDGSTLSWAGAYLRGCDQLFGMTLVMSTEEISTIGGLFGLCIVGDAERILLMFKPVK